MVVVVREVKKAEEGREVVEKEVVGPEVVEMEEEATEAVETAAVATEEAVASAAPLPALLVERMVEVVMVATRVKAEDMMEVV